MKINKINSNNLHFQRLLTPIEKIENRIDSDDAKKAIGLKNLVLITHTPSFPSTEDEDTGIGVMSLNKGALSYINFAYDNGFDGISIEPMGIVKKELYSPYDSSILSKKPVIDLKALTEDKWANILDEADFKKAVENKDYYVFVPDIGEFVEFPKDRVIYDYSLSAHKNALMKAFETFKSKVEQGDEKAVALNEEFTSFVQKNDYYLRGDSLYSILSDIYDEDDFRFWNNPLHQTLFDSTDKTFSKEEKEAEIKNLESTYKEQIDFYKFSQFVANKQQKEFSDFASELGIIRYEKDCQTVLEAYDRGEISKQRCDYLLSRLNDFKKSAKGVNIIGDKQIGYSDMDIWSNPSIFTKDEFLGAPPNLLKGSYAQEWDFNFIPDSKLFNEDGSLAEGGLYLKKITKKAFEDNPGGLRIDHILGVIDPWTYQKQKEHEITPLKFRILLLGGLKDLKELGITPDVISDLKDPLGAILENNHPEREILIQRGVKDFEKAQKIIHSKHSDIKTVRESNVYDGSRAVFKRLINTELKELQELGINNETIKGIIDPINGILNADSLDREILVSRGVKDFDKAQDIIIAKQDKILDEYTKILDKIILQAGKEALLERSIELNLNMTEDEIETAARNLLICEDLGAVTIPLKASMKKLGLLGMRNARNADPKDPTHMYREINPNEQGNYWLIGTHDFPPFERFLETFDDEKLSQHIDYISSEMGIPKEKIYDENNVFSFIRAKIARLFCADKNPKTPNFVLLNWLDVFASRDAYNQPGIYDKRINWNLRISDSTSDFEKTYFEKTLPQKRGLNIPEILSMSLNSMGLKQQNSELDKRLQKTASIMEEEA